MLSVSVNAVVRELTAFSKKPALSLELGPGLGQVDTASFPPLSPDGG